MSMDRDDRDYLAAGYALGGLSDDDRAVAAGLLETDPSFRREVAAYEDSLAGLAETDAPLEPSAEAEAAILAIPSTAEEAADRSEDPSPAPMAEPVSLDSLRASRRRWRMLAGDRKSTRLNSSHVAISYAGLCLKKKTAAEA